MSRPPVQRNKVIEHLLAVGLANAGPDRAIAQELGVGNGTVSNAKQEVRRMLLVGHVERALLDWAPAEVVATLRVETEDGEETMRVKFTPPVADSSETLSTFDPADPEYIGVGDSDET